jgi:uncharacterized protein YaeQ
MSGKYSFTLRTEDRRRPLPSKIIIGRQDTETIHHVVLKLLAFCYFFRERLQIEPDLGNANIPFVPDLAQLDYELRPALWIECGECGVNKLNKLAVKVPEAEIWVVKRSVAAAQDLLRAMAREELRRDRYQLLAFDGDTFEEVCSLTAGRNHVTWYKATREPPGAGWNESLPLENEGMIQMDYNGLWFEVAFEILKF